MRTLVRKLLDEQISRRGFVKEMAALGVTVSSAQALMGSLSTASADEAGDEVAVDACLHSVLAIGHVGMLAIEIARRDVGRLIGHVESDRVPPCQLVV